MQYDSSKPPGLDARRQSIATPAESNAHDPYGVNGFGTFSAWNINLWVMNDELAHQMWLYHKHRLGRFTARNARATALAIFGEKTPHNVRIHNRAIDWQEIAAVWNTYEETLP